ncbi:MAG: replication initiator protein A [Rhodospirillaceae bacterium]
MVGRKADPRQLVLDLLFDALPDFTLRDQRDALERPLVSLAKGKKPRVDAQGGAVPIVYSFEGGLEVRVLPSPTYGWATIWDYDLIIYLIGQLNARAQKENVSERSGIRVNPHAMLTGIGRGTGGKDYAELRAAIARLQTTIIETNIWHGEKLKRFMRFSFITHFAEDEPSAVSSGGMVFGLPPWIVDSIRDHRGVLSISPDYFHLTGGIERFLYRVARKMVGRQTEGLLVRMDTLHERSGSPMRLADFAKAVRNAVARQRLPDYAARLTTATDGSEAVLLVPLTLGSDTPCPTP